MYVCMYVCMCVCVYIIINIKVYHKILPQFITNYSWFQSQSLSKKFLVKPRGNQMQPIPM